MSFAAQIVPPPNQARGETFEVQDWCSTEVGLAVGEDQVDSFLTLGQGFSCLILIRDVCSTVGKPNLEPSIVQAN